MPIASSQEAFSKAFLGVVNQGKRAVGLSGTCRYRGPDDTKCAFGHLISDDEYNSEMEGLSCYSRIFDTWFKKNNVSRAITAQMQGAHDNSNSVEDFIKEMKRIAKAYNLEVPPHD